MSEGLDISDAGGVRTITLNRPDTRNALTVELVGAIGDAVRDVPATVRVIVITGAGGAFCSGLDLKDAMRRGLRAGPQVEADLRTHFHGTIKALVACDRPTIAAVDGAAAGFGCDLALACDVRWLSDRAIFGEIFVKRGLMPDGGGTWLLPRIVGLGRALEIMYTGDRIAADEALRIGLANRVVPAAELAARVGEFADRLAAGPPLVYRAIKRAVYASADGDLAAALEREAKGQIELLASRDFGEGIAAFLGKREPKFQGQ